MSIPFMYSFELSTAASIQGVGRDDPFTSARQLAGLLQSLDDGALTFVVLKEAKLSADAQPTAMLNPLLLAAWFGTKTSRIGLVPAIDMTGLEPFHTAKEIASLDHITSGRAGLQVMQSQTAQSVGYDEAVVDALRRLWNSWEDDATIRDNESERYLDKDKIHHVHVKTPWFSIAGPLITPRPPQGQPPVVVNLTGEGNVSLAAQQGDIIRLSAVDTEDFSSQRASIINKALSFGRQADDLRFFLNVPFHLADDDRGLIKACLDEGSFSGTSEQFAHQIADWQGSGIIDGFTFIPANPVHDLHLLRHRVLTRVASLPATAEAKDLRRCLGLAQLSNRFAHNR